MQELLQPTVDALNAFVDGRDKLVMIIKSPAADALPLTKVLEGLDDDHPSDLVWLYTDTFENDVAYVTKIVGAFSSKHELVRLSLEKEGMTPWPPIPAEVLSEGTPPAERLRILAAFSRELLPIPYGGNNVWIFYPMEIADHGGFNRLINQLVAHDFPNPWCHHLRFIVREEPQNLPGSPLVSLSSPKPLSMAFKDLPSVIVHEPDLSPQAVENVLVKTTEDESQPIESRLNALLLLAGGDFAHSRFDAALEKYSLILKYYSAMKNYALSAIALNGMGEVYQRIGDDDKANEAFEAALVPASHGDHPPLQVFQNVCQNLALLRAKAGNWEQSAQYWDCVQQLTVANRDASMKIRSLDQLGYCYYKANRLEDAEKQWAMGATFAASFENVELQNALLQRRKALYQELGDRKKELEVTAQLDELARKAAVVS